MIEITEEQRREIVNQFSAAHEHERAATSRRDEHSAQSDRGYMSGMQFVLLAFGLDIHDLQTQQVAEINRGEAS